ncbi:Collagenase 3 [Dissostichus eleginoides]|uniref:Collagenase 3 n=1 Tax=Dissostichus eleginoides TaxID=100907 RepID=A0AAD9FI37_DISEL|nr:Collagenase 3 [Dissostichus eleginoides]
MDLFWMWIPVLGSLIFAEILWSLPIDRDQWPRPQDVELAEGYLRRFYSLNPRGRVSRRRIRSTYAMEEKIREMQNFFDVENFSFYPGKPKWKNHTITYMISKYTPDMKREDVEKSFRSALKLWSDAAPLKFIKVNHGKADIVFSFARKTHGDFFPFDGPRGVLAHAFQPGEGIGGDVHFDEDETWTAGRQDDELGIQALYGKPKGKVETDPAPEKCGPNFSYDAAVMIGKEIVFFKDRYMWMRTTKTTYWNRLRESPSSTYLPSISSHVDAAYDIPAKGVAYIFTGHKYWVVRQLKMKSHARSIHEYGFSSRVKQVDAAVHVSEYGKTVFFIGEFYYRYDELKRRMDPGFPRLIQKDWPGIPKRVDAAFKLDAPTIAPTVSPVEENLAEDYISRFYADVGMTNSTLRRAVKSNFSQDLQAMQAFFGLEVTGVMNNETTAVMKEPRCGVSDISRYGHFSGRPKWEKRLITYRITQYTPDLTQSYVDSTIAQAFQLYSDVIPLNFKQVYSGNADIMILFKGGYHGDFYPFDGAGGVLAHANSPGRGQGGDTHFDDDETWTLSSRGSRTPVPTTAPKPKPPPGPDPGPEPEEPTEDPEDPLPNPRDEQCSRELVFDAATSIRGDLFFFKNGYYWRKSTTLRGIILTKVSTKWSKINSVDAAFEVPNKDVVCLFEGRQYWCIRSYAKTIISGYPKPLTNLGLPSSVSKVDAAVYVPTTGKTLIFVRNLYWSYDERRNQMDFGYPRSIILDFPGIGSKVDAAFENYGYLYFSDGPRQSEYNLPYKRVIRVLLNYGWLNCY